MNKYNIVFDQQNNVLIDTRKSNTQCSWLLTDNDILNFEYDCMPMFQTSMQIILLSKSQLLPDHIDTRSFRSVFIQAEIKDQVILARANQLITWDKTNRFCSRCGTAFSFDYHNYEPVKHCKSCHFSVYPRLSPCIITLIYRNNEVLLARASRFERPMFSTIAGFIEVGETAEQAVHREIAEEVGLIVKNINYVMSQSWPFPHSLMLGFTAEYQAGDLIFHDEEIVEARWFTKENLPQIPPRGTISRALIDYFFDQQQNEVKSG